MDDLPGELEELWSDYRRSLARRGRSPETEGVYRKSFTSFWRWALTHDVPPDPAAVDRRIVNRWSDYLTDDAVATRNGAPVLDADGNPKKIEPSTRRILWRNCRPFFSWWAKEFDAPNPFAQADAPADAKATPIPVVAREDLRALLAACSGTDFVDRRDLAMILVLIDTGVRLGEITGLRVDDWDRRSDLLVVTGKTGTRIVPVALRTGEALSRYLRARKSHPRAHATDALWLGTRGPVTTSGIGQILKSRCALAGIAPINPHRLRHTFAHEFRVNGGSEGDLLYLAGWSTPAMAHRYGRSAAAARAQHAGRQRSLADRL